MEAVLWIQMYWILIRIQDFNPIRIWIQVYAINCEIKNLKIILEKNYFLLKVYFLKTVRTKCQLKKFLPSWVSELWIYILNLTLRKTAWSSKKLLRIHSPGCDVEVIIKIYSQPLHGSGTLCCACASLNCSCCWQAWTECVDNSMAQLEHQRTRIMNLELMLGNTTFSPIHIY